MFDQLSLSLNRGDWFIPDLASTIWATLLVSVGLVVTRVTMLFIWTETAKSCLMKEHQTDEKAKRAVVMVFKFLYYATQVPMQYLIIKDLVWVPSAIGGSGHMTEDNMFPGEALMLQAPGIRLIYISAMAYHTHSLVYQFQYSIRADFVLMVAHHFITLVLVAGSYHYNYARMGAVVMLTHDASDMCIYLSKLLVHTAWKKVNVVIHCFSVFFMWPYCRMYVFPLYVIYNSYLWTQLEGTHTQHKNPVGFFIILSSILVLFHTYWWYKLLEILYVAITKGKNEDTFHLPRTTKQQSTTERPNATASNTKKVN